MAGDHEGPKSRSDPTGFESGIHSLHNQGRATQGHPLQRRLGRRSIHPAVTSVGSSTQSPGRQWRWDGHKSASRWISRLRSRTWTSGERLQSAPLGGCGHGAPKSIKCSSQKNSWFHHEQGDMFSPQTWPAARATGAGATPSAPPHTGVGTG